MSEYPMTLDELLGACKEAADLGEPIELDGLTAQAMVEDSINLSVVIDRMALMLGKDSDAVNVHNMLDEFRAILADFSALKAVVSEWKSSRAAYKEALDLRNIYTAPTAEYRHRLALGTLTSLIDRLESKSPVLEIAEVNHG